MIQNIERHTKAILRHEIEGIPGHTEERERNGYTLDDALRDEIRYRALHLSNANREDDLTQSRNHIRQALARYAAMPEEQRTQLVNLADPKHRDYLRDKVKRLVTERANILCYYNDSRDQQGGVRPCHVFIGSVHSKLKNTQIGKEITGPELLPDSNIEWVDDNTHGLRQIVFYRAVLNVPLYVFGRMKELQADYHAFRGMSRRPKVLHIDKNWESTLQDLDPEAAIDFHRKENLRRQIIGFASLFCAHTVMPGAPEPFIAQIDGQQLHDESYWILRPTPTGTTTVSMQAYGEPLENGELRGNRQRLGKDLREAIANLPEILSNNAITYQPYQALINGVRNGEAPKLLAKVCDQAILWRQQYDSRRERYGRTPDERQIARLNDLQEAWSRLSEALLDQKHALSEILDEHDNSANRHVTGAGEGVELSTTRAVEDSVKLLEDFAQRWSVIQAPEDARGAGGIFDGLFGPLS